MNKIDCAIIKDLIPSYLDGICSEESRKAVEEHLLECKDCRVYTEDLKHTELLIEKTDQNELNFMKKAKQYYARKNALSAVIIFCLCILILPIIIKLHPSYENELYYTLFTTLALGSYLLFSNYRTRPKNRWPEILSASAGILGTLYATCLILTLYRCAQTDTGLLGTELSKSGPLFNALFLITVVIELLVFAGCAVDSIRKEYAFGILPALNLTCCSLCMSYRSILFYMDSVETMLHTIFHSLAVFLLMTAGILLAEFIFLKIRRFLEKKTWEGI